MYVLVLIIPNMRVNVKIKMIICSDKQDHRKDSYSPEHHRKEHGIYRTYGEMLILRFHLSDIRLS